MKPIARGMAAALWIFAGAASAQQLAEWELDPVGYSEVVFAGDYQEVRVAGGFRLSWPALDLEFRGRNALLLVDRDEAMAQIDAARRQSGLPRRNLPPPPSRRQITPDLLRRRLESFLRAAGVAAPPPTRQEPVVLRLLRYLYLEGDLIVVRDGTEVIRAERIYLSPPDDRMVIEGAELRYITTDDQGRQRVFTVRGDRIVKQGPRFFGRDLSITSCTAGQPHVEVFSGEAEIVERGEEFEIVTRGNRLAFSGVRLLPLPDARFFSRDQTNLPIRGAGAGYSDRQGAEARIELGSSYNGIGGAVHRFLTGRPAEEFRGDWLLGLGWIEERGFPIEGELTYRAGDLYRGSVQGFFLQDQGSDFREIVTNLDGSPITREERSLIRTENRFVFDEGTHLDLTAFSSSDPAVYSEFYGGDYRTHELPETNVYFGHRRGNRALTVSGRWNLDDHSYRANRALAPFFVEELPVATFDWFSQPVAQTPWDTPVVVNASTGVGERRRNFDETLAPMPDERVFRVRQDLELSAPFRFGELGIRPYAGAQFAYYDDTPGGRSRERWAYGAGVAAGTRLSRTYAWIDEAGQRRALRHVIAPLLRYDYLFQVGGEPGDFFQYDRIDAEDEQARVRFELRNLLQEQADSDGDLKIRNVVHLDLAQNLFPIAGRDNAGDELGLFEYELIVRPRAQWIAVPGLALLVEGEHDWDDGLRTFNTALRFGKVLGLDWRAEYRTDQNVDGTVGFGQSTELMGRWSAGWGAQYDLERNEMLNYNTFLARNDHDWRILLGVSFNVIADEVTFRIEFQPTLGGLVRPRDRRWLGDQRLYASDPTAF